MNRWTFGMALLAVAASGQPQGAEPVSIPMKALYMQSASAPQSVITYVNLVVDATANGGDFVDVNASNSEVPISLILPSGVEITPANAAGLGFSVNQQTNATVDSGGFGFFTPFDTEGAHTTFTLPPNSPAGTYQVKVNSTGISSPTEVSVLYVSLSALQAGVAISNAFINPGNPVIMTAALFNGNPSQKPLRKVNQWLEALLKGCERQAF